MNYQNLMELGLSEGEGKVYLALLRLGSSTVGPIVKESKIAYSNIYEVLTRLMDKGLVSYVTKEKTKFFNAAEPYELEQYLQRRENEVQEQKNMLQKMMPSLVSLAKEDNQKLDAEIFTGYKGLRTAFSKLVEGYDKGKYRFFYNNDKEFEERVDEFFFTLPNVMAKHGIDFYGLADRSYMSSKFLKQAKHIRVKFVDIPIVGNIDICNNKILIVTWKAKNPVGFLIHSSDVFDNMSRYFDFIWNMSV